MAGDYGAMNKRAVYIKDATSALELETVMEVGASATTLFGVPVNVAEPIEVVGFFIEMIGDWSQTGGVDLVLNLVHRPLYGASTDDIIESTLTVPKNTDAGGDVAGYMEGSIYRRICDPFTVLPGEQVGISCRTAYGGSNPVGDFKCGILYDYHPEVGMNCPNLTDVTE